MMFLLVSARFPADRPARKARQTAGRTGPSIEQPRQTARHNVVLSYRFSAAQASIFYTISQKPQNAQKTGTKVVQAAKVRPERRALAARRPANHSPQNSPTRGRPGKKAAFRAEKRKIWPENARTPLQ